MNPDRIRAAIRMLYPDEMTPTAKNVLERILDDHEAPASAGAYLYPKEGAPMDECICHATDPKTWTTYNGSVEPGSAMEPNPDCRTHFPTPQDVGQEQA